MFSFLIYLGFLKYIFEGKKAFIVWLDVGLVLINV